MKVVIDPGKRPGALGEDVRREIDLLTADAAGEVKIELDDGDGNGAVVYVSEYRGRLLITVANGEANADRRGPEGVMIVDVSPEPYRGPATTGARVESAGRIDRPR